MKLDDAAILERERSRSQLTSRGLSLVQKALPMIEREFAPFEKYCGVPQTELYVKDDRVWFSIAFQSTLIPNQAIKFEASLEMHKDDWAMMFFLPLNASREDDEILYDPYPEQVCRKFVISHAARAEAAFEAIVLNDPLSLWLSVQ